MTYDRNTNGSLTFYAILNDGTRYHHTFYGFTIKQAKIRFTEIVKAENGRFFWNED